MKPSNILTDIYNKFELRKDKLFEITAFLLYLTGIVCLAFFHEPWFDEFQALQISKNSIYDILFVIPHSEGHPPLWHLILKFISIFTNNPELCIKIPNIIFSSMAVLLLIFKSPFCRIVRITLPFTYFIFYQYGVINRPYSMMMFALFIVACLYQNRNEKIFSFGLSLGFLCLSSCYGIVISFAITLTWLIEIWNKQPVIKFVKSFVKDKRFYSMLFLFLLCLFIFFEIYPVHNDVALSHIHNCPLYERISYVLFGMIADATFSNIVNPDNILTYSIFDRTTIISMCVGAYIVYLLFRYYLKNNSLLFVLTYSTWIIFIFCVYFSPHHIGILTLILIFNFWCTHYNNDENLRVSKLNKYIKIIICITIVVQIYWSASAFINELKYNYSYGKQVAMYIKNNDIAYKYNIFCNWYYKGTYFDGDGKEIKRITDIIEDGKTIKQVKVKHIFSYQPFPIEINAYFPKNIFYNFNIFNPECNYTFHADSKEVSGQKVFGILKSYGFPDILFLSSRYVYDSWLFIDYPELNKLYSPFKDVYGMNQLDILKNYVCVKTFNFGKIWKAQCYFKELNMYIKKSLYKTAKNWK